VTEMDVEGNLFLGREITGKQWWNRWLLDKAAMRREAQSHIRSLNVGLRSVRQSVDTLSGGQRQSVAVARAISWGRKVVIMDEPTAALGVRESRGVLELIKRVRDRGIGSCSSVTIFRMCSSSRTESSSSGWAAKPAIWLPARPRSMTSSR